MALYCFCTVHKNIIQSSVSHDQVLCLAFVRCDPALMVDLHAAFTQSDDVRVFHCACAPFFIAVLVYLMFLGPAISKALRPQ